MTTSVSQTPAAPEPARPPHDTYGKLFFRCLRFEFLAWSGPVALRQEVINEEPWVLPPSFRSLSAASTGHALHGRWLVAIAALQVRDLRRDK